MTVSELIATLVKLGRPDAEVTTEYHLHDYIRSVQAVPVRNVCAESVYLDFDKKLNIPQDEEQTERHSDSEWREVVVIS